LAAISVHGGRRKALAFFLLFSLLIGGSTLAHRGHGTWSEITWTGEHFEITHRMHLADAIEVLRQRYPDVVIDSLEGKARLALYMAEHFRVAAGTTGNVALETLGAELEDDFVLIYQEWFTEKPAQRPGFSNSALLEVDPYAQHFVRYDNGETVETIQLDPQR
jgi:hypothetical protein